MKGIIKLIIIVAVLVGAWFAYDMWKEKTAPPVTYTTTPLSKGDMQITIDATGTIEPEELIDVGAQVGGMIMEFGKDLNGNIVDYSSPVKKGQMLAVIDDVLVEIDIRKAEAAQAQAKASVSKAKADIQQAEATHKRAQRDRARAEKLGAGDALSQSSYDQYVSDEETARANVAVAKASLEEANASLLQANASLQKEMRNRQYTKIVSPVDGVIINRSVTIGQTLVSSMSAPSLFLIARDLSNLQIWSAVNEADIGNIRKGQPVIFTVDAFPGREFKGSVNKVRMNATMSSNVVTYIVEIDAPNPDKVLLPYLTANVKFISQDIKDAYLVPNAALKFHPEESLLEPAQRDALKQLTSAPKPPAEGGKTATGPEKTAIIWESKNNTLYPHQVIRGESNGMLTPVRGDTLKEGMNIVTAVQMPKADEPESKASSGEVQNPLAPKMPPRRKPTTGNGQQTTQKTQDGPPPGP